MEVRTIKNQLMIPDDFNSTMTISKARELYGVSRNTIRRWRSLSKNGFAEAYNNKLKSELRFDDKKAEIDACLNCTKYKCTGYCDKFPQGYKKYIDNS